MLIQLEGWHASSLLLPPVSPLSLPLFHVYERQGREPLELLKPNGGYHARYKKTQDLFQVYIQRGEEERDFFKGVGETQRKAIA
jgi:hypothetical protein